MAVLPDGVTAKDIILAIIGEIGTAGGTGYVIEYAGEAIRVAVDGRPDDHLQHVDRGWRAGRPDRPRRDHLRLYQGQVRARPRARPGTWRWPIGRRSRPTRARISTSIVVLDAANLPPIVSWGSSPEDVVSVTAWCPIRLLIDDETKRASKQRALDYMGLTAGTRITDIALDRVFIGSCTNGRIEDLRAVAKVVEGQDGRTRASTP